MLTQQLDQARTYGDLVAAVEPRAITSSVQHRYFLKVIDRLMQRVGPRPNKNVASMIETLSILVEAYEEQHYPTPKVNPGDMVVHLLESRQLSQAQLARELGVSRSTIQNVATGGRNISVHLARKLSDFFEVPIDFFIAALSPFLSRLSA